MSYDPIFTDAVKDVIGNDPVVDQFDISYVGTFYNSNADDYVTGSMLSLATMGDGGFTVGNRGKAFSKYYAEGQPPLDSTFGSYEVIKDPSLADRLQPWQERVTYTAYRTAQCYDANERYYDSCLPNIPDAFAADGTYIWTLQSSSFGSYFLFSPYINVGGLQASKIGFMLFNSINRDRTDLGYDNDPTTNNVWTWSYPYEGRYNPTNRVIKSNDVLGFSQTKLTTTWEGGDALASFQFLTKPTTVTGLMPLLPGNLPASKLGHNGRNSLRPLIYNDGQMVTSFLFPSSSAFLPLPAAMNSDPNQDDIGISYMIPADVNLGKKVDHLWYLTAAGAPYYDPGPEYLTGAMGFDDTVKFLFGYGDVNNMAYSAYDWNPTLGSSSYHERFNYSTDTSYHPTAAEVSGTNLPHLKVDWSHSIATNPWKVYYKEGTVSSSYNYITGTSAVGSRFLWVSGTRLGVEYDTVLRSDCGVHGGGTMTEPGLSIAVVDITSSYPWYFTYDRGAACHVTDLFMASLVAWPGVAAHENLTLGGALGSHGQHFIDFLTGTNTLSYTAGTKEAYMEHFDCRSNGPDPTLADFFADAGPYLLFPRSEPLDPGKYRMVFTYLKTGAAPTTTGDPDFVAIDNFKILTFNPREMTPSTSSITFGGNNYPEFREKKVDNRPLPIYGAANGSFLTGTIDLYSAWNFSLSTVIRGWKYGLVSGFPTHTKSIFRRDRYGQFRDMLEQRQYTKFVQVNQSPTDDLATTKNDPMGNARNSAKAVSSDNVGPSAVEVNFVRQQYKRDERGIGHIYNQKVSPELTTSQNLSAEVTSSVPYADGIARHRQESDVQSIVDATMTSISVGTSTMTVV